MVGRATPRVSNREATDAEKALDEEPLAGDCIMILDSETKAVELPEDHGNELRLCSAC